VGDPSSCKSSSSIINPSIHFVEQKRESLCANREGRLMLFGFNYECSLAAHAEAHRRSALCKLMLQASAVAAAAAAR